MPAEALRYDITPMGLHYLLVHYEVPAVAADTWRLRVDGEVSRRLSLTLDQLRSRKRVTMPVTLEWLPCSRRPAFHRKPSTWCSPAPIMASSVVSSRITSVQGMGNNMSQHLIVYARTPPD